MSDILHQLIFIGEAVGTVESVHYYNKNFISLDGTTGDGKKYSITLSIKEEEKNGD